MFHKFFQLKKQSFTFSITFTGRCVNSLFRQTKHSLKPGIDCARLPREAMFVALPRKVDSMLPRAAERTMPRANLARVEPNRSGSLSRGKGISVCCALSVEKVLCVRSSVDQQPHAAAARYRYPV
jgi:hypothetical protein